MFDLKVGSRNGENLWVETKSAEAGWSSAVELLAVYRLELSEKEIHSRFLRVIRFATLRSMTSPPERFLSEPTNFRTGGNKKAA